MRRALRLTSGGDPRPSFLAKQFDLFTAISGLSESRRTLHERE